MPLTAGLMVHAPMAPPPFAPDFYVSPAGSSANDGSIGSPWSLTYAFSGAGGALTHGKQVALRGGTYVGSTFTVDISGTASGPITFRQFPGELATIAGNIQVSTASNYVWFWGFELIGYLNDYGTENKVIHCVIHDSLSQGIAGNDTNSNGGEYYGNIIYNNGSHYNLDHGIYVHNAAGAPVKRVTDNVLFNNWTHNIQIFVTSFPNPDAGIYCDGNVCFNAAAISSPTNTAAHLLIDGVPEQDIQFTNNFTYELTTGAGVHCFAPTGPNDIVVSGNYFMGGTNKCLYFGVGGTSWNAAVVENNACYLDSGSIVLVPTTVSNWAWGTNTLYRDPAASSWAHNGSSLSWAAWKTDTGLGVSDTNPSLAPTGVWSFVRASRYESGRANVIIYNWDLVSSVNVDVSGLLSIGQSYVIYNAQSILSGPIASGTYSGGTIAFPMAGIVPPSPVGRSFTQAPTTGPRFQVFVIRLQGA